MYEFNGKTYKETDLEDMDKSDLEILRTEVEIELESIELIVAEKQFEWKNGGSGLNPIEHSRKMVQITWLKKMVKVIKYYELKKRKDYDRTWIACAEDIVEDDVLEEIDQATDKAMG